MYFRVLLVACLVAVAYGADNSELRGLLEQIRGYLNVDRRALNAYEDVQTVSADPNQAFDSNGNGHWTKWLNVDKNPNYGWGEYEDCSRIKWQQNIDKKCYLGCEKPIAYQYAVVDSKTKATWDDIKKCIGPMDSKRATPCGFKCVNREAASAPKTGCDTSKCEDYGLGKNCVHCPDVRVRFFCANKLPDENACCPYSDGCQNNGKRDMRSALEAIADIDARRDAAAQILDEVRAAIEPVDTE